MAVSVTATSAEYKQVTVLFADVVHSMDIVAMVGAERWREIVAHMVQLSSTVLKRYGAAVDQFTGDGIMAVFGAPLALEDHAARACLAALDMQQEIQSFATSLESSDDVTLRMRIGLNSGQVVAGDIGSGTLGYTAIGEQVGLAQRMESVAPPGGVMLSESAFRLVRHIAIMDEPEYVSIKNVSQPILAWRLRGVVTQRALTGHTDSVLVGRDREINLIKTILTRSATHRGRLVRVVGPAGIGKSRTVSETAMIAKSSGIDIFVACCESHTREVPFYVAAELLRSMLRITHLDPVEAREEVRRRLPGVVDEDLHLLNDFLGMGEPRSHPPGIDPDARRRRLTALMNYLSRAHTKPSIIVVEDIHWIDEASESMLGDLLTAMTQTGSVAIVTYRPEYKGSLSKIEDAATISLDPLTEHQIKKLIHQLVGPDQSMVPVTALIAERAAGNPFFAKEMVRELVDLKVLEGDRGNYRCGADIADIKIPATLQSTLAARIDRLGPSAKRTLNAASVIGSSFDEDLLAALIDNAQVQPLIEAGLVDQVAVRPHAEYSFRHPLIRAVAYESQLRTDRVRLHRQLAAVIEQRNSQAVDENAPLIAEHLEAAGDLAGAYAWHMRAGAWLMGRDVPAARVSLQRARRAADGLPAQYPDRTALRMYPRNLLCATAWRVGAEADEATFNELRELCTATGSQASLISGYSGMILSLTMATRHRDAARLASEQIALFDSAADQQSISAVMSAAMFAKMHAGEVIEACRVAQTVIDLLDGDSSKGNIPAWGLGSPLAVALCYRAQCRAALGVPAWRTDLERSIAIQRELTEAVVVIVVTYGYAMAVTNGLLLPDVSALAETAEVLEQAEKSGDDIAVALAQIARGLLLTYAAPDDVATGRELLARGREAKLSQRDYLSVAIVDIRVSQLLAQSGQLDEAIALSRTALEALTSSGEQILRGAATSALATALLMRNREDDRREADLVVSELTGTVTDPGFVLNDIWLLRLRALLAQAYGDEVAYRHLLQEYRAAAESLGFEGHMAMAALMETANNLL